MADPVFARPFELVQVLVQGRLEVGDHTEREPVQPAGTVKPTRAPPAPADVVHPYRLNST